MKNLVHVFRKVAFLEGISFLLFGITMPLKYTWGFPQPNYWVGLMHGLLFVVYVGLSIVLLLQTKISFKGFVIAMLASLLPFGTFVADARAFKHW